MTRATGVAIAIGAIAGVVVALNGRSAPTPTTESEPRLSGAVASTPPLAPPLSTQAALAEPPPQTLPSTPSGSAPGAAAPSGSAPNSVPTASAGPDSAPSAAPVFDLTPPSTREQLHEIELRCVRKIPEDCERAARSLAAGNVLPMDAPRARMLRRVALTVYVKQCEGDRAAACARLAEMHEAGEFVQKNLPHARSLRARAAELCRAKPSQFGCPSSG